MTTASKIKLQGTNVSVCLLPPIDILETRYKLSDDHEGIVARSFKLIPGKTRRGTEEGAPVGTYSNSSLRQQVEVTWMDEDTKHKVRVQKSRIVYRMAHGEFDESLVIDHIDGNPNNNHPSNLRPLSYHENFGNRASALKEKYPKKDPHLPTGVTRDYKFTSGVRYIGKTTIRGITHMNYFENPRAAQHWLAQVKKDNLGDTARRDPQGFIIGAPNRVTIRQ
ncbi:HNH endonuclease signature motif containing protein [Pseudomonas sp. FP2196]|uniref:HNH endonuclease signature motif containing protein n=1 Tax=Pseudomonas sp. FP2196 TaxID=2954086 RepID=UPI0027375581|nr:HNH endonuclease signature motif containing protein [Pseudomonas sp. FP2196]WLH36376.1 HNH endonuclease signature motif containing protein [Pseudomonas sp. FP2196]